MAELSQRSSWVLRRIFVKVDNIEYNRRRAFLCVSRRLHRHAVRPRVRGRVHHGLSLPDVRRAGLRRGAQQFRQQTGLRVNHPPSSPSPTASTCLLSPFRVFRLVSRRLQPHTPRTLPRPAPHNHWTLSLTADADSMPFVLSSFAFCGMSRQ